MNPVTSNFLPWFVKFYAPWCPHCQRLEPIWDAFYHKNKSKINVASVDCTSSYGSLVCKEYEVKGYPTLLYFPAGGSVYH